MSPPRRPNLSPSMAPPGRRMIPPMPPPIPPGDTADDAMPGDLAEAGIYPTEAAGFDHGLVVLAMGCPYWLLPCEGGYRLLVEAGALEGARRQLECFDRESVGWPPRPPARGPSRRLEIATPLLWAAAVMAVYLRPGRWPGLLEEAGALDAQAVFDRGEWWRIGTALFLHADVGHLVSNELSGIFAFSAVLSTLGRRRGWAPAAARLAHRQPGGRRAQTTPAPTSRSARPRRSSQDLGLLTGRAVRVVRQHRPERSLGAVLAPLAAGLVLLGLFGAGGIHIDVGAHAAGFSAGLAVGVLRGRFAPECPLGNEAGTAISAHSKCQLMHCIGQPMQCRRRRVSSISLPAAPARPSPSGGPLQTHGTITVKPPSFGARKCGCCGRMPRVVRDACLALPRTVAVLARR